MLRYYVYCVFFKNLAVRNFDHCTLGSSQKTSHAKRRDIKVVFNLKFGLYFMIKVCNPTETIRNNNPNTEAASIPQKLPKTKETNTQKRLKTQTHPQYYRLQ